MYANSTGVEFLRALSKVRKRKKISSSIKHEIRHFHFVVVQKRQMYKKVLDAREKLLFC